MRNLRNVGWGCLAWAALAILTTPTADAARVWKVGNDPATGCDGPCDYGDNSLGNVGDGIRAAMLSVQTVPGDTVLVWPGTYPARIPMRSGVALLAKDGPLVTNIQGSSGSTDAAITFLACSASTTVDGFTITWDSTFNGLGGGVRAFVSDGRVTNSVIRGCVSGVGAGVYCQTSDMLIDNNLFLDNNAIGGGGVIAISGGSPIVRNNTIVDSFSPFGSDGAALFAVGASHTVEKNIFIGSQGAAAVYCDGISTPDINCNLFFDSELGHFGGSCVDSIGGSWNIIGDPQFCDPVYGASPGDIGDHNVCTTSLARITPCGITGWVDPATGDAQCTGLPQCGATAAEMNFEITTWGRAKARYFPIAGSR